MILSNQCSGYSCDHSSWDPNIDLKNPLFLQLEVYWTKQSLLGVLIEETLSNGGDLLSIVKKTAYVYSAQPQLTTTNCSLIDNSR